YNINGQLIRSLNYKQLLPQNAIDVATLPNGIYQIILVADDGGIFNNRFVKQ
ncbi:MAG: T9SS type A sorting domain-containing protein, partial [Bacteroidia bacterium]|nr:T9SS type A sorting domain-containing protein [Bacteroidia bacterium]